VKKSLVLANTLNTCKIPVSFTVFDIKCLVIRGRALCTKVKNLPTLRKKLLCFKPIRWLHILRNVSKFWLACTAVYATKQRRNIQRSKLTHVITLDMCLVPMRLPQLTLTCISLTSIQFYKGIWFWSESWHFPFQSFHNHWVW
jgi:hypothetical protein